MIISARYLPPDSTQVEVTDDVTGKYTMQHPAQDAGTYRHVELDEWVIAGNIISAADQYYGQGDLQVVEAKYQENEEYATQLATDAELNPQQGVVLTERKARKNKKRRDIGAKHQNNKNKKIDNDLIDYQYTVVLELDGADDMVDNITDRTELENWSPIMATWSKWTPPN